MNLNRFFNSQTKTVNRAAGILAISGLISRVLGVVRDGLLAKTFGAGPELDVYLAAFRIPDLIYNILIVGGVGVVFLPLFSEYFSKKDKAWRFAANLLNISLFLLIFLSLVLFIFTPSLVRLIVPGFSPENLQKTILLTRLMYLGPIFLGLSAIFSGVLQYFNRFLVYSLCPILYNLSIIFGILFLTSRFGILGVVLGVVLGAFLHLIIQIPSALSCGFKWKPILNFWDTSIKRAFLLMLPRTFGITALQINLIVITAIASTLSPGSITVFNFANNIQYFPIGIIGVSFAVAVFPQLTQAWAKKDKEKFLANFSLAFRQILYLIIPSSCLIFILRNQIVSLILRHGQFSSVAAQLTSSSLALFSFGIFALSLIPLIFRAFFSIQDTKTPALITSSAIVLNIILSFYFTRLLGFQNFFQEFIRNAFSLEGVKDIAVLGLPLAFSITIIFQFILSIILFRRKIDGFKLKKILDSFFKILLASFIMVNFVYFGLRLTSSFFDSQTFMGTFIQTIIIGSVGVFAYTLTTYFLNLPESKTIKDFILKQFKWFK